MRNTNIGTPVPQPVTDSPLLRLIWCIDELDRRKAEAEAKRSAASAVVTASARLRSAATPNVAKVHRATRARKELLSPSPANVAENEVQK